MNQKTKAIALSLIVSLLPVFMLGAWYPFNPRTGDMQTDGLAAFRAQQCHVAHYRWASPDAAAATAIASVTPASSAARIITTGITNPDVARNLVMACATSYSGVVDVTGTNLSGEVITEAFTLSGSGTITGTKAFRTVTSFEVPANETLQLGTGEKLGLPYMSAYTTVFNTFLNNTIEGTAAAVTRDVDEIEKNTLDLNSSLNNTQVDVLFTWY